MIKLVVFDWNGTLLNDARICLIADNHVIKAFGGEAITISTYRKTIIIPAINFYSQHIPNSEKLDLNKLSTTFHNHYETVALKAKLRTNAKKLLQILDKNNINSIILSNHTISGINDQLKRLKIEKYFSAVLANPSINTSMKKRNKKEKLEVYLREKKYKTEEIIIVGDSPEEVEIGKQLGIKSIAIVKGFYDKSRLVKSKPDYLIEDLKAILKIIKN